MVCLMMLQWEDDYFGLVVELLSGSDELMLSGDGGAYVQCKEYIMWSTVV